MSEKKDEKNIENKEDIKSKIKENKEKANAEKQKNCAEKNEENTNQETQKLDCIPKSEYIKLKYQFAEFINNHKEYETEFENYKKRTREEIKQAKLDGISKAVETLLPALDSFKKARSLITDKASLSGINLIEKSILSELEKLGVKRIKCVGEPFNADFHNAVMLVENKEAPSGTVVEEIEAGYTMGEKVIKFCQVIVSK